MVCQRFKNSDEIPYEHEVIIIDLLATLTVSCSKTELFYPEL
jgi:hypothetical protein